MRPGEPADDPVRLDDVDRAVLAALHDDGRLSMRELAGRVGIARASAYNRVERLQATGVLLGFTTRIDPARAGRPLAAYVHLKVRQQAWRTLRDRLLQVPEVEHAAQVSGEFDVTVLVRTRDAAALRELVLERLQSFPEIVGTSTALIFDET